VAKNAGLVEGNPVFEAITSVALITKPWPLKSGRFGLSSSTPSSCPNSLDAQSLKLVNGAGRYRRFRTHISVARFARTDERSFCTSPVPHRLIVTADFNRLV
jgi:hypothetical protein